MRKLLIYGACGASLVLAACSSVRIPGVYKVDVPQGNIVTQEMVDQLKPGMSKRQVTYAMGTPLVTDSFHPERWDYIYRLQPGNGKVEQRQVTLYFKDDTLARIEGDYHPRSGTRAGAEPPKETSVTVNPPPEKKGFFGKMWDKATGE